MGLTITLIYENVGIRAILYDGCTAVKSVCMDDGEASACAGRIAESFRKTGEVETVICPGGCLKPVLAGCYEISAQALEDAAAGSFGRHRYNHLMEICAGAAEFLSARACFADAISTDELLPLNRISSHAMVKKCSRGYFAEHRAAMWQLTSEQQSRPDEKNYIVAYLDDLVSVGVYERGRCLDINDMIGAEGPMGFTSSGDVPCAQIAAYFEKSDVTYEQMQEQLLEKSGILQYLGTDSPQTLDDLATQDARAALIAETMAYQAAKWIGSSAVVLRGRVDGILLTGKGVRSDFLTERLLKRIEGIAPVTVEKDLRLSDYLAGRAELVSGGCDLLRNY
ncbi:MAG: hypothetical protein LUE31_09705 [Lachnospiraceae bacterium]|nr:hypothetical protein [Lachnospiraceae bacterium]